MLNSIDILAPPRGRYQVLHYMTECLTHSFLKLGVKCRLFDKSVANDPKGFLDTILEDRPDCTLSFNGLLPDEEGNFLCDMLAIPHVAFLVDSPPHFFPMAKSPYTIINCIDRNHVAIFKEFEECNPIFVPHGVDGSIESYASSNRPFDLVMLGSYFDPEEIRAKWVEKYSNELIIVLDESVELTLSDPDISHIHAFVTCMQSPVKQSRIDPQSINYSDILIDMEDYVRAVDRIEVLTALTGINVHVFGEGSWKRLQGIPNIHVHSPVNFHEALEIMKKSKFVLNSIPHIKNGGHERFFSSYLCGALPITGNNTYLVEDFVPNQDALFYQPLNWTKVNDEIHYYLEHEDKRVEMVERGKQITLRNHTWDNRAKLLYDELPLILDGLK